MSELQDKIEHIANSIKDNSEYFRNNEDRLDIYEGNLLPYVDKVLQKTLSDNYYNAIKERIIPINVLTRVIDKMSKVYIDNPNRSSKDAATKKWIAEVEKSSSINMIMGVCDSYSHLFKGYLLQPYVSDEEIKLRPVAYDRFMPFSKSDNPEKMTGLAVIMGEKIGIDGKKYKSVFYYEDDIFIPILIGNGKPRIDTEKLEGNDGENVFGFIPYVYGNRSLTRIMPKQDTDIMQIAKTIPVMLSDLGGAVMFQCFSVLYGIDINADNLTMTPNAFWSLKSDQKSDTRPEIGTIKPQVDSDKARDFIKDVFSLWLETKGVRIGSIGSMNGANSASGISKIIDEMDVYELKKQQIEFFKKEENELWQKLVKMNNHWSKLGEIDTAILPEDVEITVEFDEPRPEISRDVEVETLKKEVDSKFTDRETAMIKLHPDLSPKEIQAMKEKIDEEKSTVIGFGKEELVDGMDKNEDKDQEGLQ